MNLHVGRAGANFDFQTHRFVEDLQIFSNYLDLGGCSWILQSALTIYSQEPYR